MTVLSCNLIKCHSPAVIFFILKRKIIWGKAFIYRWSVSPSKFVITALFFPDFPAGFSTCRITAYVPSSNDLNSRHITWKDFIACSLIFLKLVSGIEDLIFTGLWGKVRCPCQHLGTSSSLQREKFDVFIGSVVNGSMFNKEGYFSDSKRAHFRHKQLQIQVLLIPQLFYSK